MQRPAKLFEAPGMPEDILFTLKDIAYTPEAPKMNEPFIVKGKVELFKIPFVAPIWVIVTAEYPEEWWESIIPIIGAPQVREMATVLGGDFEVAFDKGFVREGEFKLTTRLYAGPTLPIDKMVLPPFPPTTTDETTFIVAGEAPPEEIAGFRNFKILSYGKNGGTPVTPPGVLELGIGDRCRINLGFEHKGAAAVRKFHAAIWTPQPWDPHDEILAAEKSFSVPLATDWEPGEESIDIVITSDINPGTYGLYAKLMGVPGPDIFSQFLEDVITITGVPVKGEFRNFGIIGWTPDPAILNYGDSLIVTHHFEYKGPRYTTADIHTAIGTRGAFGFDEILAKSVSLEAFGPDEDWMGYDVDVTIPITTAISPGTNYDLYSKLTDIPGADLYSYKDNIIEIVAPPPAGSITAKWINKAPEGSKIPIPTEVKADNHTFEVGVRYKNTSGRTITGGCKVEVWDPDGTLRASPAVDWTGMSHNEELSTEYNICPVDKPGDWTIHIDFLADSTVVDSYDGLLFTAIEEVVKPPPVIQTFHADNITHNSVTFSARLTEAGFCANNYCYIEWGETTGYGHKSSERRLYPGDTMEVDVSGLSPDTTYHFRAVAVGRCVTPNLVGYGTDRTFTTEKEVVKGFTFRIMNPPAGTTRWRACCVAGGRLPCSNTPGIYDIWTWTKSAPDYKVTFFVWAGGAAGTLQYDEFDFRLRNGKNYIWDFAAHELRDYDTGEVLVKTV